MVKNATSINIPDVDSLTISLRSKGREAETKAIAAHSSSVTTVGTMSMAPEVGERRKEM